MPHVHVAVPDLTAALELQRQDALERTVSGIVIDGDRDDLAVEHVDKRVAACDDLQSCPQGHPALFARVVVTAVTISR